MKVEYVDSQRETHGVQPVLEALRGTPAGIAPSTYYAVKTRPESARAASDRVLVKKIRLVYEDNYNVYGARKVWAELNRRGVDVARCTVERLMRDTGLRGLNRPGFDGVSTEPGAVHVVDRPVHVSSAGPVPRARCGRGRAGWSGYGART